MADARCELGRYPNKLRISEVEFVDKLLANRKKTEQISALYKRSEKANG